jgi:hypothetical protein
VLGGDWEFASVRGGHAFLVAFELLPVLLGFLLVRGLLQLGVAEDGVLNEGVDFLLGDAVGHRCI